MKKRRSVLEAASRKFKNAQFLQALREAAGSWKDEDHPELVEKGTYQWVREQRESYSKKALPLIIRADREVATKKPDLRC